MLLTSGKSDSNSGFRPPSSGRNLNVLPFALDVQTWQALLAGFAPDSWTWDELSGNVRPGPDGIREANLFPQGTGSPGNRGTIDIGASNNSTADISRQIVEGISAEDLEHLGGRLELGPEGTLDLNGDTGISAGMKAALASIIGQPRILPLFGAVAGNGNKAQYTIVGFAGVRVLEVELTGKMTGKRVIIQPARVQIQGGIPATDDQQSSYFLYSPVWLVR
jgi:hypothetical protein